MGGQNIQDPKHAFPDAPPNPPRLDGDPGNTTTLDHVLNMSGIVPNITIRDVMDIRSGFLCYKYVE